MSHYDKEVFAVLLLDNKHILIEFNEIFFGTINATSVYPRDVVKLVPESNAAAVIFAHNHPSETDKRTTATLKDSLDLINVQELDHFIVGGSYLSFAEK